MRICRGLCRKLTAIHSWVFLLCVCLCVWYASSASLAVYGVYCAHICVVISSNIAHTMTCNLSPLHLLGLRQHCISDVSTHLLQFSLETPSALFAFSILYPFGIFGLSNSLLHWSILLSHFFVSPYGRICCMQEQQQQAHKSDYGL